MSGVRRIKQSGMMSRIKFGSDDEAEKTENPKEIIEKLEENNNEAKSVDLNKNNGETKHETVVFTTGGDADFDVGAVGRRKSRKSKKEVEHIEVSADLLAEINKPKDEPKRVSIESQLKKNYPRSTTPLTGKAAEREAQREADRQKREKERQERAAAREKEREEAAKKRKEQKEALDKKMAEQKRQRMLSQRRVESGSRASIKSFKEKLEVNSPAPASPSNAAPLNTKLTKLLAWVRFQTQCYEGVNVENFSDCWADGLAFAALIHSYCPEDIPIVELSKDTRRRNFELAFAVAKEEGVMDLLDVEDMVTMRSPDPKSIITYLYSVYDVFAREDK